MIRHFQKTKKTKKKQKKIEIKQKNLSIPWISKGLRKSLKRKQRLYEIFFKQRRDENYETYKNTKICLRS